VSLTSISSAVAWLRELGATELVTDSRKVQPINGGKTAFIAWPGAAVDGRAFIPDAIKNGAVAALMEADTKLDAALQAKLDMACVRAYLDLKATSGHIASEFYGRPSEQLRIIAITGTNGKTSTSWWLAEALSALPAPSTQKCAVVGTLGTGCIGAIENNGLTTPDPVLLQARLKAFVGMGCEAVALEASSIGIVEGRLNGTQIHTAVFTNFTQDHLDYHGTMEAYWQAKAELFDWPNLQAACVNLDDTQGLALLDRLAGKALDVWTFATEREARVIAKNITMTAQGLAFDVVEGAESHHLQTSLVGRYNVSNLLGVIASMRSLGISLALSSKACEAITPVPGRLEVVSTLGQPLTLVDYAHTPDALEKALTALREVATVRGGKLWCVFGCGGNRDASKRPVMGAMAKRFADKVVLTSDNPRNESANAIVSQILLGTGESEAIQVQVDRALAIAETIAQAKANDVIVIAGKGHEDYQEIAGVKSPFSDQAHARAALATWSAKP
jgi:UDP-N-acetylmuramyl-tripeptide synthetase